MRDLARDANLGEEALESAFTRLDALGGELESDLVVEGQVVREMDLAHSTFAVECDDPIASRYDRDRRMGSFEWR